MILLYTIQSINKNKNIQKIEWLKHAHCHTMRRRAAELFILCLHQTLLFIQDHNEYRIYLGIYNHINIIYSNQSNLVSFFASLPQ